MPGIFEWSMPSIFEWSTAGASGALVLGVADLAGSALGLGCGAAVLGAAAVPDPAPAFASVAALAPAWAAGGGVVLIGAAAPAFVSAGTASAGAGCSAASWRVQPPSVITATAAAETKARWCFDIVALPQSGRSSSGADRARAWSNVPNRIRIGRAGSLSGNASCMEQRHGASKLDAPRGLSSRPSGAGQTALPRPQTGTARGLRNREIQRQQASRCSKDRCWNCVRGRLLSDRAPRAGVWSWADNGA